MKVLKEAHLYELDSVEGTNPQKLQFIEKAMVIQKGEIYETALQPAKFQTVTDGVTNEEVLKVLIDRLTTLEKKLPCRENSIAVRKAEECLMWLEKRTANRIAQNVENTPLPHKE